MGWLQRALRRRDLPPRPAPERVTSTVALVRTTAVARPTLDDATPAAPPLLPWLLGADVGAGLAQDHDAEARALQAVDALLHRPGPPTDLMPRAGAVIPQLLAMLRRDDLALDALARQVGRDLVLTAEVLRMARGTAYGAHDARLDLPQALGRLGVAGLNTAISRMLLRPLFEGSGDGLHARAAARLWQHAEAKARHGSALAAAEGQDAFDGYLAGLLHNSGWTIALREIDRSAVLATPTAARGAAPMPSAAFADALPLRCDALFGKVVAAWCITPALTALAEGAAAHGGLAACDLPLAALLRRADALAGQELVGATGADTAATPA